MKRRKWNHDEKFKIILEGLKSQTSIAALCNKHEIQQSQYYNWRDKFLRDGACVFQSNEEPCGGQKSCLPCHERKSLVSDKEHEVACQTYAIAGGY